MILVISVHVPTPAPESQPEDDQETRGLGLRVVEHLAARWGRERADGHNVWAALAVATA
ncbi:MAG: hypothetical protein M3065_09910 [Actinomycetota bacterium]|nr:hypothetical protein [Actinomycetota bacterium]